MTPGQDVAKVELWGERTESVYVVPDRDRMSQLGVKPAQIIRHLKLLRPIYEETSAYGHFGRTDRLEVFTWEKCDKVAALKAAV